MNTTTNLAANALKNPAEMPFAAFAESVNPSGAVNRFPVIGPGKDVYSYTVYMNGPLAAALPEHARENTFKDVTLHALTEKLQLNSGSPRDNVKVAEIVALRHAWMSAVLEASVGPNFAATNEVTRDYAMLTEGMSHPWIAAELEKQQALTLRIRPALERAGEVMGTAVKDLIPKEVSVGPIISQDLDFTIQRTHEGEVVTHENRRLDTVPPVGSEVTVSYYRGSGQVVASLENLKVSPPFVDPISGDLAVMVEEGSGAGQMVLFNSVVGFDRFIQAHGMDKSLMLQAMEARAASPKAAVQAAQRELVKLPYLDANSQCLALDYKEHGVVYTAMFRNANEMGRYATEFGLGPKPLAIARALEDTRSPALDLEARVDESLDLLVADLKGKGFDQLQTSGLDARTYVGKIVAESAMHVAQDLGRGQIAIHSKASLDKVPAPGDSLSIKFQDGRGQVNDMTKAGKDFSR